MDTLTTEPAQDVSTRRYTVISTDSHVAVALPRLREYLDPRHHAAFDDYVAARAQAEKLRSTNIMEVFKDALDGSAAKMKAFLEHPTMVPGGAPGLFDPAVRLQHMDDQGIAGDVLIPDFAPWDVPFGALDGGMEKRGGMIARGEMYPPELVAAGCRSWNHWLADFCSHAPERFSGMGLVPVHEPQRAAAEVRWARAAGLRGGILLPGQFPGLPTYDDPVYDPLWQACEETGMSVNVHVGNDLPQYTGPTAFTLISTEQMFFGRRALWFFMWGGVFERFPNLRFVITEQDCYWVAQTLRELEDVYDGQFSGAPVRRKLSLRPTEYWTRQCYVAATFMSRPEAERRHLLGLDNIMWAADYPHLESTWPYTQLILRNTFHDIPEPEVRKLLSENAAPVYGFDLEALAKVADRIGPSVDEVARPLVPEEVPQDYWGDGLRDPAAHKV